MREARRRRKHGLLKVRGPVRPTRTPPGIVLRQYLGCQTPHWSHAVINSINTRSSNTLFAIPPSSQGGYFLSRAGDLRAYLYFGFLVRLHSYPLPGQLVPRHSHLNKPHPHVCADKRSPSWHGVGGRTEPTEPLFRLFISSSGCSFAWRHYVNAQVVLLRSTPHVFNSAKTTDPCPPNAALMRFEDRVVLR